MPFLLAEILNFQGSTHRIGVGSFSYLYEKTSEDIVVSDSKELEVSFYDYKNESYTFQYNQYEGKIRLINTRKSIAPSHNITVIIWNEDQLEEQIKYAIEYLI